MSQSSGAKGSPTKGSFNNSPARSPSRTESCLTTDSDWTSELSDSFGHSRDSEVFSNIFQRSVANLPGPQEPTVKAAEYVQGLPPQEHRLQNQESVGQRRRRVWSESCGIKRNQSRNWSSDGTGFSSVESFSSAYSLQDSGGVSQWVEALDNNVFDTTVVPDADQTIVGDLDGKELEEEFITNKPLSKQSTISEDSVQDGLTRTLTEENLKESLNDNQRHLLRTLSNSDILDLASSITTAVSRKRELFIKSESWNESCDSEQSVKSVTSVDELLDVVNDPEELLLNLGFGLSTADPLERIPHRFLASESSAAGISVDRFQQDVRERDRGYNFCLTGGLRGLERFLSMQLKNSGVQFSPFASPSRSPHYEELPSFPESGQRNGLGFGHNGDYKLVHPLPINLSEERSRSEIPSNRTFSSRKSSVESYLSTDESVSGSEAAYESDFSSSGDWSDQREESRRLKGKGKRLQLTTSNLDTVEEELESQLRAKSPCPQPKSPHPLQPLHIETRHEELEAPPSEAGMEKILVEKVSESATNVESSIPQKSEPIKAFDVESLKTAQDSFEIEEISLSEIQTDETLSGIRNGLDRKESLTRNESQQSDSSGFADELAESISPASPQHERAVEEPGVDASRKNVDEESLEPNNNLEATDLSGKLSDIPGEHRTLENDKRKSGDVDEDGNEEDFRRTLSTRPRSGTFPSISAIPCGPEGPKSVVEVLETLQKNYKKAEKEVQRRQLGESVEKRRRLFSKMDTVDLDNYSFTHGKSLVDISTEKLKEEAVGDESAIESAIEEGTPTLSATSDKKRAGADNLTEELIERVESEDLCDSVSEEKKVRSSQRSRADQIVDQSLGLDSASSGLEDKSQAIEIQRELQDLNLMQRALFKYKQDLWELEEWSTQMYNQEEDSITANQVRKELESLGNLRKNVRKEVEKMEGIIEAQMKEVISQRGSMDNLSERFAHWSLNHIDVLNKMVTLMKEQDSLRQHLMDIKSKEKEIIGQESPAASSTPYLSKNVYKTLNKSELVTELVNTQLELARLQVMARTEMTAAIAEMKKCILSDIRKEVDRELRLMQWQLKDRDEQIQQLKHLLQQSGKEFPTSIRGDKINEEKPVDTHGVRTAKGVTEAEKATPLKEKTGTAEESSSQTDSQTPIESTTEVTAEI